jgi:hypothetical protein
MGRCIGVFEKSFSWGSLLSFANLRNKTINIAPNFIKNNMIIAPNNRKNLFQKNQNLGYTSV